MLSAVRRAFITDILEFLQRQAHSHSGSGLNFAFGCGVKRRWLNARLLKPDWNSPGFVSLVGNSRPVTVNILAMRQAGYLGAKIQAGDAGDCFLCSTHLSTRRATGIKVHRKYMDIVRHVPYLCYFCTRIGKTMGSSCEHAKLRGDFWYMWDARSRWARRYLR